MADPTPNLEVNTGSNGTPTWVSLMGGSQELRWIDASTDLHTTGAASWPQVIRPTTPTLWPYVWAFTADTTGKGAPSTGSSPYIPIAMASPPTIWHQLRWAYASGSFASAPILTMYPSIAHGSPTPGDGSILGGDAADTGSSSYIKATAFGVFGESPSAAPTGAYPTAADHTAGSISTTSGAWKNAGGKWQDLQGDADSITCGAIPGAPGSWEFLLSMFAGPNIVPGDYLPVCAVKYTWA